MTGPEEPDHAYRCTRNSCTFRWMWNDGYFHWQDGRVEYPANADKLLKPALVREHGYLFIESIKGKARVWRCAVQGCDNTIVDEAS